MQRTALPDLNTFLLVAEHLSFRAAAERLELTAPTGSARAASVHRHGSRPEMRGGRRLVPPQSIFGHAYGTGYTWSGPKR
jgi:DNA-binding transcriptional LysR family regulator